MNEQELIEVPQDEQPATSMLAVIERASTSKDVDVDKMRALLDMQKELHQHKAFMEFAEAFARVQSEVPQIEKRALNSQTNSSYAKQEHIAAELTPVTTKHGFSMMFGSGKPPADGWIKITCWLMHSGGHKEFHEVDLPYDKTGIKGTVNKTDIHAAKSAYTYGRSMLTCLMFNVALKDKSDDDGNKAGSAPPKITEEQAANLQCLIDEVGANKERFLKWAEKDSLEEIPASWMSRCVETLEARRK